MQFGITSWQNFFSPGSTQLFIIFWCGHFRFAWCFCLWIEFGAKLVWKRNFLFAQSRQRKREIQGNLLKGVDNKTVRKWGISRLHPMFTYRKNPVSPFWGSLSLYFDWPKSWIWRTLEQEVMNVICICNWSWIWVKFRSKIGFGLNLKVSEVF